MSDERDAAAAVIAAEQRLLDPDVRADPDAVDAMLAPDFREMGKSGTVWTRDAIVVALAADPTAPSGALDEPEVHRIASDLLLLTYELASVRRSTVWRLTRSGPRAVFHQGTPILGEDA